MKIRTKITLVLLAVSLSSLLLVGGWSFYLAQEFLLEARGQQLLALASGKKANISQVLEAWQDRLNLISSRTQLRLTLAEHLKKPDSKHTAKMREILNDALSSTRAVDGVRICDLQGEQVASVGTLSEDSYTCKDFLDASGLNTGVREFWMDARDEISVLVTGPIKLDGDLIGVLHVVIHAQEILAITTNYDGLGETGETLLAGRTADGSARFLTFLRHNPNRGLTLTIPPNKIKVPITQAFLKNETILMDAETPDYRGQPVIAATGYIPGADLGIVAKIDREEAFRPIRALFLTLIKVIIIISILAIIAGIYLSRFITTPILSLARVSKKVADGDLSQQADITSRDEIGEFAQSFNKMLASLNSTAATLAKNEARLRTIVDNTVDGLITITSAGQVETFNKSCESMFGYSAKEMAGRDIKTLIPTFYDAAPDQNPMLTSTKKGTRIIYAGREMEGRRKGGATFPMEISITEIRLEGKSLFSGILRDITERKESERLKDEFVSVVSHEIRTPITSIQGALALLRAGIGKKDPKKGKELLDISYSNCQRLGRLVDDVLDIQKIEAGKIEMRLAPIDVNTFLEDVVQQNQGLTEEYNVKFKLSRTKKHCFIQADADRLNQVITNLLSNAAKFSPTGETVTLKTQYKKEANSVIISVHDKGPGIPDSFKKKIFDKFAQADSTAQRKNSGTGLGLSITQKIVENLNGEIWFTSKESAGSTFFVRFPLVEKG